MGDRPAEQGQPAASSFSRTVCVSKKIRKADFSLRDQKDTQSRRPKRHGDSVHQGSEQFQASEARCCLQAAIVACRHKPASIREASNINDGIDFPAFRRGPPPKRDRRVPGVEHDEELGRVVLAVLAAYEA
jgi:hypothetical protein